MTENGGGGGDDDGAAASSSRNDDDGDPEGGGRAGSSIASQSSSSSSSSSSNDDNHSNNNFENYLKLRMKYVFGDDGDSSRDAAATGGGEEMRGRYNYNHFTTPLVDPTTARDRLPTSSSSPPPPTTDDGTDPAASPFSDLERSHVVDGFFDIFAEKMGDAVSSGRLSRAWQQKRPDGGGGGGGGGLFSRRWWPWKEYNSPSPDGGRTDRRRSKIEPNDYAAERAMITPHLTPLIWGGCCALLTLSSLRLGRWYRGRRALPNGSGGGGNNAKRGGGGNPVERWHNATLASRSGIAIGNNARRSSTNGGNGGGGGGDAIITSLGTVLVDASLSILFGMNAAVFLSRPDRLTADFAAAPLLGGGSALAEELCGPFSDEMDAVNGRATTTTMRRARGGYAYGGGGGDAAEEEEEEGAVVVPYSELWKDENLGGYGSLRAVRDFVANCREREGKNIRAGEGRRRERREGAVGDEFPR